jgi:hypothetical protein
MRYCWRLPQAPWGGAQRGQTSGKGAKLKSDKMSLPAARPKRPSSGRTTQARKSRVNEGPNSEATAWKS